MVARTIRIGYGIMASATVIAGAMTRFSCDHTGSSGLRMLAAGSQWTTLVANR